MCFSAFFVANCPSAPDFLQFLDFRSGRAYARPKQHRREQHSRRSKSQQAPTKRAREQFSDENTEQSTETVNMVPFFIGLVILIVSE